MQLLLPLTKELFYTKITIRPLRFEDYMNMPQAEFLCGMPQKPQIDWRLPYRRQVFIFERHREFEPMRDLAFLIARWLRKKHHLPPESGFVHKVLFPEQPEMEMLGWTAHRAFHLIEPNDDQDAPTHIFLFTSGKSLMEWKRAHMERVLGSRVDYSIHANCHEPSGLRMLDRKLLIF